MRSLAHKRFARRNDLALSGTEFSTLARLRVPESIQRFLDAVAINDEIGGETILSVRQVLAQRRAHCIEGAFVAACALWIHGEPPLLLDLQAVHDFDHVVALFRRNGRWGAISKTNGIGLRWRDPVYKSVRELAMSWLHEYYNKRDHKTLRTYSVPYDLRRMKPADWVTGEDGAWDLVDELEAARHYDLMTRAQARSLVRRDPFEREVGNLLQYKKPKKR